MTKFLARAVQVRKQMLPVQSLTVAATVSVALFPRTWAVQVAVVPLNAKAGFAIGAFMGSDACAAMPSNSTKTKDTASSCHFKRITSLRVVSTIVTNEGGDM